VRRLLLLTIGLSALLWTVTARTGSAPPADIITLIDVEACELADDPPHSSHSDRQWRAQQHGIAAVTESMWKSASTHAVLSATLSPLVFEPSRAASSPDPPVRSALPYLRHTPLLI
jgi:hypothetical protein